MLSEPIPNTGTAVNLLKTCEKQFKFVSGNGMRSDQDYIDKLKNIGVKNVIKVY